MGNPGYQQLVGIGQHHFVNLCTAYNHQFIIPAAFGYRFFQGVDNFSPLGSKAAVSCEDNACSAF
ncbi:hypothetical protein D3C75_1322720 [compost metagenome]